MEGIACMRLHEYGGDSISLRMYNREREKKDTRVTNQFKLSLSLKSDSTNRKKVYNIANGLTLVKDNRVLPAAVFIDKVMSRVPESILTNIVLTLFTSSYFSDQKNGYFIETFELRINKGKVQIIQVSIISANIT